MVDKTNFLIGLVFDNTKGLIRLLYLTTTKNFSKLSKEETIMRAHTMVTLDPSAASVRGKGKGRQHSRYLVLLGCVSTRNQLAEGSMPLCLYSQLF